jgi:hypothetical protein
VLRGGRGLLHWWWHRRLARGRRPTVANAEEIAAIDEDPVFPPEEDEATAI